MNPDYTNADAKNLGNSQNDASPRTMRNFNTFPMSYSHGLTARYGDLTPFFIFEAEPKDKVPFSSFHEMISDVVPNIQYSKFRMFKDYYSVPFKSILPNTWDLIYANPTQGDDVPDDAICVFSNILSSLSDLWSSRSEVSISDFYDEYDPYRFLQNFVWDLKWFFLLESFFDDGSLLSLLGCKLSKYFVYKQGSRVPGWYNFSNMYLNAVFDIFDSVISSSTSISIKTDDVERTLKVSFSDWERMKAYEFRRILEFMRDNSDFYIESSNLTSTDADSLLTELNVIKGLFTIDSSYNIPLNISRLVAYQLVCFHFHTNDKVDYIYSADLYRNMMYGFIASAQNSNSSSLFFYYNGNLVQYDVFSGHFLNDALYYVTNLFKPDSYSSLNDPKRYYYYYLRGLFEFRKSLKFGDYFNGSRPHPLAVGDVNAPVTSSGVSAIDITKNVLMQRFLNAVNKTGRKISDYMKGIRGANTMPLLTDPKFLAGDTLSIGSQQIENTGDNQGNIVSLMRSEQSKYAFETDIEDPCILIGILSFDGNRVYTKTIDRQFFIKDRFDMFNPYMQNIGDQEIYAAEKQKGGLTPISYTLRHMEFKQRYNIASGGFVDDLPSYLFVADNGYGNDNDYEFLTPDFIRSHNTELDRFFPSLNGFTLCQYYHFKFKFHNDSNPNRNMEYSPTIL